MIVYNSRKLLFGSSESNLQFTGVDSIYFGISQWESSIMSQQEFKREPGLLDKEYWDEDLGPDSRRILTKFVYVCVAVTVIVIVHFFYLILF